MVKHKRTVGLIAFIKGSSNPTDKMPGCASFDHHYGGCVFAETCSVQCGNRCRYFEDAVLPTALDIGLSEHVHSLYQAHIGMAGEMRKPKTRPCPDCGGELLPRRRYCSDCNRKRRLDAKRESKRKRQAMSRQLSEKTRL